MRVDWVTRILLQQHKIQTDCWALLLQLLKLMRQQLNDLQGIRYDAQFLQPSLICSAYQTDFGIKGATPIYMRSDSHL